MLDILKGVDPNRRSWYNLEGVLIEYTVAQTIEKVKEAEQKVIKKKTKK